MAGTDLPGEKGRENPTILVFEGSHGRSGFIVVYKKCPAGTEAFGKDAAVIAVFLLGRRHGLPAGKTDRLPHIRQFGSAFFAYVASVWQDRTTDRALPRIEKRKEPVVEMKSQDIWQFFIVRKPF